MKRPVLRFSWLATLAMIAMSAEISVARAQGPQPSKVLKNRGLVRVKGAPAQWVLADEKMVMGKFRTAKAVATQFEAAQKAQRELASGHQDPDEFISYCRMQMNLLDQQINFMDVELSKAGPTGGIPAAVQWHNTVVADRNAMVVEYNRLRAFLRGASAERGQMQQINEQLASELEHLRRSHKESVNALREMVDTILMDYDNVTKQDDVVQALSDIDKSSKTKQKLGPSRDLQTAIEWLERIEKSGVQRQQRPESGRGRR
jgi:hypothetical protein